MNIQDEAQVRVDAMIERIAGRPRPVVIHLSDYADEECFNFLLPNPGWTFAEWQKVNNEVGSQLRRKGFKVRLVKLAMGEYFDFLARYDLQNTTENRAQFVAWKTAPEPKPEPLR